MVYQVGRAFQRKGNRISEHCWGFETGLTARINRIAQRHSVCDCVIIVPSRGRFPLPIPKLTDAQIAWIIENVAAYIQRQRQTYRGRAMELDSRQRSAMQPFFPASVLEATRLVALGDERVSNPEFYGELIRMGFDSDSLPNFQLMAAVTFTDTVVSHGSLTDRLLFHELVHVVQYDKLGFAEFAARYVKGFLSGGSYEAIPLEMNASGLERRFAAARARPFSVASEVHAWIDWRMI